MQEEPEASTLSTEVEEVQLELCEEDLDPEDIAKARIQAEKKGLRYQTYLKMIIHEALIKAETSS